MKLLADNPDNHDYHHGFQQCFAPTNHNGNGADRSGYVKELLGAYELLQSLHPKNEEIERFPLVFIPVPAKAAEDAEDSDLHKQFKARLEIYLKTVCCV